MLRGLDGHKLSKSHGTVGIAALREAGARPADLWRALLPWLGLGGVSTLAEAVACWPPVQPVPADLVWVGAPEGSLAFSPAPALDGTGR